MLAVSLVSHGDSDHARAPVADEPFCSGVEDRLGAYGLGSSTVDLRNSELVHLLKLKCGRYLPAGR